jgi:nitrite reductase/ring-hydroxylating ferredoxin subunit
MRRRTAVPLDLIAIDNYINAIWSLETMTTEWIPVALVSDVPEGATLQAFCGSDVVCLYRVRGKVYATQDLCTHGAASLADGLVDGENIECPFHQGLFHIPTGKAVGAPCTEDLRVYGVKEEGEDILVTFNALANT